MTSSRTQKKGEEMGENKNEFWEFKKVTKKSWTAAFYVNNGTEKKVISPVTLFKNVCNSGLLLLWIFVIQYVLLTLWMSKLALMSHQKLEKLENSKFILWEGTCWSKADLWGH